MIVLIFNIVNRGINIFNLYFNIIKYNIDFIN